MVSEVVSTAHCAWIDDRVKELGKEGFDPWCVVRAQVICCHNLKSVRFEGRTLDSIDDSAFYDCRNLVLVDLSG